MAAETFGTQNQPHFAETGAPQIGTDLTIVADYAAKVGNRKTGTTTQRTALSGADVWDGLEFYDTTVNYTYTYDTGAWVGVPVVTSDLTPSLTAASGWTINNAQATVWGSMAMVRVSITKATSAITATTTGNITNQLTCTLTDTTLFPNQVVSMAGDNTGYGCLFYMDITGTINISALPPGIGVSIGDSFSVSATYIRTFP